MQTLLVMPVTLMRTVMDFRPQQTTARRRRMQTIEIWMVMGLVTPVIPTVTGMELPMPLTYALILPVDKKT